MPRLFAHLAGDVGLRGFGLMKSGGRLVVDLSLLDGDQFCVNSSELVAQLYGLFQGHGGAVELPDDYEVESAVVPGGLGDHPGELVPGAGHVHERG